VDSNKAHKQFVSRIVGAQILLVNIGSFDFGTVWSYLYFEQHVTQISILANSGGKLVFID